MTRKSRKTIFEKKVDVILKITSVSDEGDMQAEHEGGLVSVFGAILGETVNTDVVSVFRGSKLLRQAAITNQVIKCSPERFDSPCAYFGECTGCDWQHIKYEYQLEIKKIIVNNNLNNYSSLKNTTIDQIIGAKNKLWYRNHARFTVRNSMLGFVNRNTRKFIQIDECMIMHTNINKLMVAIQSKFDDASQFSLRSGVNTDDYLIQPAFEDNYLDVNLGGKFYKEKLGGSEFRISSPSFFQVNIEQAENLCSLILSRLNLRGTEFVVDAYSGVGVFASVLAPYSKNILAIEESKAAVADAQVNLEELSNVNMIVGQTGEILKTLVQIPDVLVLDPSRKGCDQITLATVLELLPNKIAYVSCSPKTLSRDLNILVAGGYKITSFDLIDMFPQTRHVESLVVLSR